MTEWQRNPNRPDPVEEIIREALDNAGIEYRRDDPLNFMCEEFCIEVKQYYSDRITWQVRDRHDVIIVQGKRAAWAMARMIKAYSGCLCRPGMQHMMCPVHGLEATLMKELNEDEEDAG